MGALEYFWLEFDRPLRRMTLWIYRVLVGANMVLLGCDFICPLSASSALAFREHYSFSPSTNNHKNPLDEDFLRGLARHSWNKNDACAKYRMAKALYQKPQRMAGQWYYRRMKSNRVSRLHHANQPYRPEPLDK